MIFLIYVKHNAGMLRRQQKYIISKLFNNDKFTIYIDESYNKPKFIVLCYNITTEKSQTN